MRKWIVMGVLVLVVVAAAVFFVTRALGSEPAEAVTYTEATAELGSITQTVFGHGTAEPVEQRVIRAARGGTITSVSVAEGQPVRPGDELFRVDGYPVYALGGDDPFYRALSSNDEEGADVEALQQLLGEFGLYDGEADGIYGSATQEAVEDFFEERGEDRVSLVGPETFQLVGEQATLARADIAVGDVVSAGQAVAVATVGSGMQTVLQVNEIDISLVKVGQRVELIVDALPGESYTGTVTSVPTGLVQSPMGSGDAAGASSGVAAAAAGQSADGIVEFPVEVTFDDPGPELLAGMSVDGDIVVAEAEHVLVVPATAVIDQDGKDVVLVPVPVSVDSASGSAAAKDGGQVELRPVEVEVGMSSDSLVEIRSGLTVGQVIVADTLVAVSDDSEEGGLLPGGIPGGRMMGVRQGIEGLGGQ